ncbi:MAG: periplasmic heavy metal sensor [Pseudomonadota bacterium]
MTDQTGQTPSSPRWMKVLLLGSLAVNVAVVGVIVGFMMKGTPERGSERQIYWIMQFVPETRQDDARALFRGRRDSIRDLMRDQNTSLDQILIAIRAEPYSPETLEAAMKDRRGSADKRRIMVEEGLLELLQTFSQDERAYFADQMEEQLKNMRRQR